jgi:1,4-dihydroxy-2-naphthoyl-CoA hydrolase
MATDDLTTAAGFNASAQQHFPGHLDITITHLEPGLARAEMRLGPQHLTPTNYLHGAAVVGIADTVCGAGCQGSRPDGAVGFTTIELKCNFLGTASSGVVTSEARMIHGGRNTQVWDADVTREDGKRIASFRCTQMVLWPKA